MAFAQTAAEHRFREQLAEDAASPGEDATTLQWSGEVALSDDDSGGDPYDRTGRIRRLVR